MATSIAPAELPVVKAAGGILLRSTPRGEEVMIVYRNRYQDWTLPKGKLRDGESFPEAALREVEEETGCSCRLGSYLGIISYAYNGVPKVVMFWKMAVIEERPVASSEEIGEALWLPVAAALQRLTHAQEKSLLSRVVGGVKAMQPQSGPTPALELGVEQEPEVRSPEPPNKGSRPTRRPSREDKISFARLLREVEAFRVEMAFLQRRGPQSDKSWPAAAMEHLTYSKRCLENNDIEGGLQGLQAARRYAVLGLNPAELAARAQMLREEARKISSWRSGAIQRLLAITDDKLTAARVVDAMGLRDEESADQCYTNRIAGDRLRVLLLVFAAVAVALLLFMLLGGWVRIVAPVLLFGLLGASVCAAQSLLHGKSESRTANLYVMLTPVLFGALAALAAYAIHQYLIFTFDEGRPHLNGLFALAFLFGCLGQRVLARFSGPTPARTQVRQA